VKLEVDPESVNVASVCVDHVPRDKSPPTVDPERLALIVTLAGSDPGVYKQSMSELKKSEAGTRLTPVGDG
jgi:hypothetical protein